MSKRLKTFLSAQALTAFFSGAIIFGFIGYLVPIPSPLQAGKYTGGVLYQVNDNYTYIDPLLACDIGQEDSFADVAPIRSAISSAVSQNTGSGKAAAISVYYRSLSDAHWFDIHPETTYVPGSLLKVFVMMAYYQQARETKNPALLDKEFAFEVSKDPVIEVPGDVIPHLQEGQYYSINDLIKQMIVYSDNDALNTLVDNADAPTLSRLNQIFTDLKIPSPLDQKTGRTDYLSVDAYSMVFRVLYGATYLNRAYSEQALGLLAQAHYKSGLVAGVSDGVAVAHKFGIAVDTDQGTPELHDCGIVYYPKHPYLLCVMTKGTDFTALQNAVQQISGATYQEVKKLYPN